MPDSSKSLMSLSRAVGSKPVPFGNRDNIPGISVEEMRQELRNWLHGRGIAAVNVEEETNPPNHPHDDYRLVYKVTFSPNSLRQARLEFHLTSAGYAGFGLETWRRIANRLNVTQWACRGKQDRFAAGREPSLRNTNDVTRILDLVSRGKVAIQATVLPLIGLVSTRAVLVPDHDHAVVEFCRKLRWSASGRTRLFEEAVGFEPWE